MFKEMRERKHQQKLELLIEARNTWQAHHTQVIPNWWVENSGVHQEHAVYVAKHDTDSDVTVDQGNLRPYGARLMGFVEANGHLDNGGPFCAIAKDNDTFHSLGRYNNVRDCVLKLERDV